MDDDEKIADEHGEHGDAPKKRRWKRPDLGTLLAVITAAGTAILVIQSYLGR